MSSIRICLNSILHHTKLSHHHLVFPSCIASHRNYSSFNKPYSSNNHHNLLINYHDVRGKRITLVNSRSISTTLTLFSSPTNSNSTASFQDIVSSESNVIDLSSSTVPEPPSVPTPAIEDVQDVLTSSLPDMAEMPLSYLGLASSWYPTGWIMHYLDLLHLYLPWWGAIAFATLTFRILMFPLIIKSRKNADMMKRAMPEIQACQLKLQNAQMDGDQMEASRQNQALILIYKKYDYKPLRSLFVPMVQGPIFVSFYRLLNRMTSLPVESLKIGGIFWFTDLTVPDPYSILPVITCASLWISLEFGVEAGSTAGLSPLRTNIVKLMVRGFPVLLFPILYFWDFSSALLTYWCTTNIISVAQVFILKIPYVSKKLNMPKPIKYNPDELPIKNKSFIQSFQDTYHTAKVAKKIENRQRQDEVNFRKAALGPIKKTYKYDPTKVNPK